MGLCIYPVERKSHPSMRLSCSYAGFNAFIAAIRTMLHVEYSDDEDTQKSLCEDVGGDASLLAPLLAHSDCDGDLTHRQCCQCYPALERCVKHLEDGYLKDYGKKLVALMKWASADSNRCLVFY